jgi:hypothetical protein
MKKERTTVLLSMIYITISERKSITNKYERLQSDECSLSTSYLWLAVKRHPTRLREKVKGREEYQRGREKRREVLRGNDEKGDGDDRK